MLPEDLEADGVSCMSIIRYPHRRHCILPGINLMVERSCGGEMDENVDDLRGLRAVSRVVGHAAT